MGVERRRIHEVGRAKIDARDLGGGQINGPDFVTLRLEVGESGSPHKT